MEQDSEKLIQNQKHLPLELPFPRLNFIPDSRLLRWNTDAPWAAACFRACPLAVVWGPPWAAV